MEDVAPWRVREVYLFWTVEPDYWEDITCCMDACLAALMQHASQVGAEPEKLAGTHSRAGQGGREKPGYAAAEAFKRFQF